ncbi:LemA family protein [Amnibacterium endophyticum]|uniref:LemA family protein n=1 Tax=Amnibacterium endophyticum TaxID=2109337 RepID=A0ABW4L9V2_9MICO
MDAAAIWIPLVVVVILVVLLALLFVATRSSLLTLRDRVDESWRDIEQLVRQRADLLPRLSGSVRQYATHEPRVFESVEAAREETLAAKSPERATVAETHLQQALRSLLSTADSYPQLTASPEFLGLRSELGETEERMQASRRFYNGGVRELNTKLQVLPSSFVAKRAGIERREFFEVGGSAVAEPPRIQF